MLFCRCTPSLQDHGATCVFSSTSRHPFSVRCWHVQELTRTSSLWDQRALRTAKMGKMIVTTLQLLRRQKLPRGCDSRREATKSAKPNYTLHILVILAQLQLLLQELHHLHQRGPASSEPKPSPRNTKDTTKQQCPGHDPLEGDCVGLEKQPLSQSASFRAKPDFFGGDPDPWNNVVLGYKILPRSLAVHVQRQWVAGQHA